MGADDVASVYGLGVEAFDVREKLYHQSWSRDEIKRHMKRDLKFCLVVEMNGEIVGFALGHRRYSSWSRSLGHFEWIAVSNECRRTGVADALCEEMLGRFEADGVRRVLVDIESENAPSKSLFERHSFRSVFSVDWLMKEL
jgi:ribosomal protein S18 acetylase RimI-like enzyme